MKTSIIKSTKEGINGKLYIDNYPYGITKRLLEKYKPNEKQLELGKNKITSNKTSGDNHE